MWGFREEVSSDGQASIGYYSVGYVAGGFWVVGFKSLSIETAMRLVNYLNGGTGSTFELPSGWSVKT